MSSIIYTYALAKELADKGEDYLDTIFLLIIQLMSDQPMPIFKISHSLKDDYQISGIPNLTIQDILKRASKREFVTISKNERYALTQKGIELKDSLEDVNSVKRKISSLIEDIKKYFKECQIERNSKEIHELLNRFIECNNELLIQFFRSNGYNRNLSKNSSLDELLINYILDAEEKKPDKIAIIEQMVLGSFIITAFKSKDTDTINKIKQPFNKCTYYLDSNIVISLLYCDGIERRERKLELIELIRNANGNIKVFDFTLQQTIKVFTGYIFWLKKPEPREEKGLYRQLENKGWKKSDVDEFISTIPEKLNQQNIPIEETNINIDTFRPEEAGWGRILKEYKGCNISKENSFSFKHDFAAIEMIRKKRGSPIFHIEDAKAIFLSADEKLRNFNYSGLNYKEEKKVCEVILGRLIATIIWLKNPKLNLSFETVISAHSKGIFTKHSIWNAFFKEVQKQKEQGKITDRQISMLFYNNYIDGELRKIDTTSKNIFTQKYVKEQLKTSQEYYLSDLERDKHKIEEDFEKKSDEKVLSALQIISIKKAKRIIISIKAIIGISLIIVFIVSYIDHNFEIFNLIHGILFILLICFSIGVIKFQESWKKVEEKISSHLYQKMINDFDIESDHPK